MSTPAAGSSPWWHRWRRRAPSVPVSNEIQDPDNTKIQDLDNLVELAALERMIQRSDGFRIAFAVANHPTLRARLIRAVRRDLPDLRSRNETTNPPKLASLQVKGLKLPPNG